METAISTITGSMTNVFSLVTTCFEQVLANPILVLYMAVSFIGLGIGTYKMLRSAV